MKRGQIVLLLAAFLISGNVNAQSWKEYADSAKACKKRRENYKAIELYQIARKELKKDSGNTNTYARLCVELGGTYQREKQNQEAEEFYEAARKIREILYGKDHPDYVSSCYDLADLFEGMIEWARAEPFFLEAKQIRENVLGSQHPDYASSCLYLGNFYYNMAQFTKVESLYLEAKQIRGNHFGKEHSGYVTCCANLGLLYSMLGQYDKAEPLYLEIKEIQAKVAGKEHPSYASSCVDLSILYADMGQFEKAELLQLEARQIWEKVLGKEHVQYAESSLNLGNLYVETERYVSAEPLLLEAKQIWERPGNVGIRDEVMVACSNLASLYFNTGAYDKAEPLYLQARGLAEKIFGKDHPQYASINVSLANLYMNKGEYAKAETLYVQTKEIQGKIFGKQHRKYGSNCIGLANLYWLQDRPLLAENEFKETFAANTYNVYSVFKFTNEKEKAAFIKNVSGEDDKAYSFYATRKISSGQPYSLSLFHRNLILSTSQSLKKRLFSTNDTIARNKYEEWLSYKKLLATLYARPVAERNDLAQVEEKAGQLEKELTRFSSSFRNQSQEPDVEWQSIQKNLQAGEAAIEFAEFSYYNGKRVTDSMFYIALVLRKDKPEPELVVLFEKKQMDSILNYKNTSAGQVQLSYLYTKQHDDKTKSLYELIWKPIEQKLTGINTVYFAPAGSLQKIAFAALPVNNKEVLSDKYQLVQLNTTASVGDKSAVSLTATDKIILYGGVQYDADSTSIRQAALQYSNNDVATRSLPDDLLRDGVADFYYLSGTEKEVNGIGKLAKQNNYDITIREKTRATEESFKALTGENSPAILHIATHGFFFPDPKNIKKDEKIGGATVFKQSDNPLIRSGLALAGANNAWKGKPVTGVEDGILTSYEVSNMYLPNTKLAVLSACETGLGDIQGSEGVYGLQRAFKMAGVKNLVMSLWKVPDLESSEFMQEFYKNLFAKQTISDAFYHAQDVMKNKYRNDPYKWAAWILVR